MEGKYHAVIMAGGGGTRLWPLSRRDRPKQALQLLGERTLFQMSIDRLLPMLPPSQIVVATVAEQAGLLAEQAQELPEESFLVEPAPRGTASIIGLAATVLRHHDPESVMACLTADHFIRDENLFRRLLQAAYQVAQQGKLVTLGIAPTHASTGYGYLKQGRGLMQVQGFEVFEVDGFKEKPSQEVADEYFESGNYVWNSGMFVWRAGRILSEIERTMPELAQALERIAAALDTPSVDRVIEQVWAGLKHETIDYGVMERARDVVVIPAQGLGWWDMGTWDGLFEVLEADDRGNLLSAADTKVKDTRDTLLFQDPRLAGKRLIATLGVHGLIIIDTGDAILVASRHQAQDVRDLVADLEAAGLDQFL